MVLAFGVRLQIIFTLEPLGALKAKMSPKTGQVLSILSGFVLREMAGRFNVGEHLVVISIRWS